MEISCHILFNDEIIRKTNFSHLISLPNVYCELKDVVTLLDFKLISTCVIAEPNKKQLAAVIPVYATTLPMYVGIQHY